VTVSHLTQSACTRAGEAIMATNNTATDPTRSRILLICLLLCD
jgi:hypothetical protein